MRTFSQTVEVPVRPPGRVEVRGNAGPAPYMNPYLAGIGLGLTLLAAFVLMGRGLGASGAFNALAAFLLDSVAPTHAKTREWLGGYLIEGTSPLKEWLVFEVVGVFVGAWLSSLLARRVRMGLEKGPRIRGTVRLALALGGGIVTACGAALARGCTSGQALTGGSLLNLGSWIFMLAVFAGAYAVAWFFRWEWRS